MMHQFTRHTFTLLLAAFILCFANTTKAQTVEQADKHFNEFEFSLALDEYKAILENGEPSLAVVQRIADIYRILNNSKEAEFWYAQVITFAGADPSVYFLYAESAKRNGNYGKAKLLFLEYSKRVPGQAKLAERMAASCDTAIKWMRNPKPFKIEKTAGVNSEGADFSPFKTKDGLFFASDRLTASEQKKVERYAWTGNGYIQMYFAPAKTDSTWSTPEKLPSSINTSYHNGPAIFHEPEQTLYFTRTHAVRREVEKNSDPTSWFKGVEGGTHINRLGIYTAVKKGKRWRKVKKFKYNKTEQYSVGHPAVTADGQTLFFVSDMPGGFGETDIYYSERQSNGDWGPPINAGIKINTSGRESFPNVGLDGNLYFSSDGHLGMGGLDIFKANGPHKLWTGAENMKYPFNTSHDDLGFHTEASGNRGLISSGRYSAEGFDDILIFQEQEVPCTLIGETIEFVTDELNRGKKKELVVDNVRLVITKEGSEEQPIEIRSDANGRFTIPVQSGGKYTIRGSKPNYLTQTITISPNCHENTDSVKVEMVFNRDTPNKPIVVENIYYELDKYEITPEAAVEMDKLVQTLKDNPTIVIELSSHTDSRQTNYYNQMLSDLRAQAAVDYLVLNGIDRSRLIPKGYGETQLINNCGDGVKCPEDMHQQNRRTEFKILRKINE